MARNSPGAVIKGWGTGVPGYLPVGVPGNRPGPGGVGERGANGGENVPDIPGNRVIGVPENGMGLAVSGVEDVPDVPGNRGNNVPGNRGNDVLGNGTGVAANDVEDVPDIAGN
jgi:hypothetical protein